MTELKEALEKSLKDNSSLHISINCHIPSLTLSITDSRQMFLYGIGSDRQQGFTLNIHISTNSNKGEKIDQELGRDNFLADFKKFGDKRATIYLKDFGARTEAITEKLNDTLQKLTDYTSGHPCQLIIKRVDGNFQIE